MLLPPDCNKQNKRETKNTLELRRYFSFIFLVVIVVAIIVVINVVVFCKNTHIHTHVYLLKSAKGKIAIKIYINA